MPTVRRVYIQKPRGRQARGAKVLRLLGFSVTSACILAFFAALAVYLWVARDLPRMDRLSDYRPNVVSYVYDRHGVVVGEFKYENQTRILVGLDRVPKRLVDAVVSAEDKNFFRHAGVDPGSILRAALANLRKGELTQGGSTITQQVTRALLLSREKTFRRKLREILLAHRIESNLNKQEILYLYLNEIYFGSGAYGVQAAARIYFGKDVGDLSLAECALLAGLPQAPSRYSPRRHPEEARRRQRYVLDRMVENGLVTPEEADRAAAEEIRLAPLRDINLENAPYFTEHVRRYVMETYGVQRVLKDGLEIHTTLDLEKQKAAQRAVDGGLRDIDKRQGWRGPEGHLQAGEIADWMARHAPPEDAPEPKVGDVFQGVVVSLDAAGKRAVVDTGALRGTLALADMAWAAKTLSGEQVRYIRLTDPQQIVRPGDLIQVELKALGPEGARFALEQRPEVQGALVAMDPHTFEVLAMVGGSDFAESQFNRAVQSRRQPGSSFKPIVYAAALDAGFTPASTVIDTALVFADGWRPRNYGGGFQGRLRLRRALAKSINTVTVRLVEEIGASYVLEYAGRLGLDLGTDPDLSLALGSHEVTPLALTSAYAVFASGGLRGTPRFIRRIVDRAGNVLEEHGTPEPVWATDPPTVPDPVASAEVPAPPAEAPPTAGPDEYRDPVTGEIVLRRAISAQTAFLITSMMQSVVREGTGMRALALGKHVAGKTGTTNENRDAWFLGFTPRHLAGAWVGFDQGNRSLGSPETGSAAALPIWLAYMKEATREMPDEEFSPPPGIVFERIDPETGLLATPETRGAILECFKAGTAPTEFADAASVPRGDDFFRFDQETEETPPADLGGEEEGF